MVRTKNLGHSKKLEETVATPSNAPPAASVHPPAQASAEKELRASQSREKTVPPAKKKLKTNPPSASSSSSSEEEDPMEVSSDKSVSLHSEKDSEDTELEPELPQPKSASAAKAYAAAKGKQPMEEPSSGNDFYANLTDDFLDENSRLYRRVYVRGHWFSFSEKDIAQALQLPENVSNAVMSMDRELMHSELTGARSELKPGESLRITHLTFTHASLMRFALSNWVPNSNKTVVSQDVASLLYRITSDTSIDLASHILNQIVSFRRDYRRSNGKRSMGHAVGGVLRNNQEKYDSIVSVIEETKYLEILSPTELMGFLEAYESRRERHKKSEAENAFQSKINLRSQKSKADSKKTQEKQKENNNKYPPCGICKRKSHLEKDC
ncbi:uncharacterized protein LOC115696447 [Cannabis sativa]|uniref:uncharacterized protein LOC115696447 n=1 Tax=Cannabis sativa TaxID=3483 RepID=UPI0029CA31A1|nr:uncharacterized protein LOC115696447 [Cannabis sativa]